MSGTLTSDVRFAVATGSSGDQMTEAATTPGLVLVDVTGDGRLDLLGLGIHTRVSGVQDAGAFRLWRAPFTDDAAPDVTFAVTGAVAFDQLGW